MDTNFYKNNAFQPESNLICVDFSTCETPEDIHKLLKESFGLPEYYGKNWSALDDCLYHLWLGEGPVTVEIRHFYQMSDAAKQYCIPMLKIFEDVHLETPNVVFHLIS